MSHAIGIDFGTSNSTVGFLHQTKPALIALEEDKTTLPSAVFYDTERLETLFGRKAIAAYTDHYEGRLLRSLKSILGSSLIEETTQIGHKRLSFHSIIGEFLQHLKLTCEYQLQQQLDKVVLGRPVWFVDNDETADKAAEHQLESAASLQGFKHIQFQYEPIAAALDYEQSVNKEELALIVDIGGGTSDFSIVRVSPQRRGKADRKEDILANSGVHVGGTDLDMRLSVNEVMPFLGYKSHLYANPALTLPAAPFFDLATWHKIILLYNNKTLTLLKELHKNAAYPERVARFIHIIKERSGHRLAGDVETTKIHLSENSAVTLNLDYIEEGLSTRFKRKDFEAAITEEKEKITQQIKYCLQQAELKSADITTLFLTGGSSAIPCIVTACQAMFPSAHTVKGNRLGSVGIGLAIDAALKFGK